MKNMFMRIGVVSDTHMSHDALKRALLAMNRVDAIFHLGDMATDIIRMSFEQDVPIYTVIGNSDSLSVAPETQVVELGGKRFFLTHGHKFAVDFYMERLLNAAQKEHCDAALYGHTHVPSIQCVDNVWLVNPGSTTYPRKNSDPSCAVITIENNQMHFDIIKI